MRRKHTWSMLYKYGFQTWAFKQRKFRQSNSSARLFKNYQVLCYIEEWTTFTFDSELYLICIFQRVLLYFPCPKTLEEGCFGFETQHLTWERIAAHSSALCLQRSKELQDFTGVREQIKFSKWQCSGDISNRNILFCNIVLEESYGHAGMKSLPACCGKKR